MAPEKLSKQRDLNPNALGHLDIQPMDNPAKRDVKSIAKLQTAAIDQIKKSGGKSYLVSK